MATAILQARGLSVGTITSPHLERINERLEFEGRSPTTLSSQYSGRCAELERFVLDAQPPTWFELVTAAAYR